MKILVVEDDRGQREALRKKLEYEGYLVDLAENGGIGCSMLLTGIYDLAILDVMMPEMNGFEVLERIRARGLTTPVIILTALSDLSDKLRGIDGGADDYMTKPFAMEELLARIRMVTRRFVREFADNNLRLGDLTLNTGSFEILNEETRKHLKLGGKEYQVLEYLMMNAGSVVSRQMITDKVWGYDSETEYNNVDVYMSFLRRKLKLLQVSSRIRAVRGVGYVLEEEA